LAAEPLLAEEFRAEFGVVVVPVGVALGLLETLRLEDPRKRLV